MQLFARTILIVLVTILGCAGFSVATVPEGYAHDVVLRSTPADGATVEEFPREVVLEFSGIPQSTFNTVAISDVDSQTVLFTAQPQADNQVISVTVPEDVQPGPGTYMVGFQITSSDGHATRGKITFTVAGETPPASEAPAPDAMPASDASSEEKPTIPGGVWLVIVGIVALIALAGAILIKKRK